RLPRPAMSWASMIGAGREMLRTEWYLTAIPGPAILITVLALNLMGDGLNDALNRDFATADAHEGGFHGQDDLHSQRRLGRGLGRRGEASRVSPECRRCLRRQYRDLRGQGLRRAERRDHRWTRADGDAGPRRRPLASD